MMRCIDEGDAGEAMRHVMGWASQLSWWRTRHNKCLPVMKNEYQKSSSFGLTLITALARLGKLVNNSTEIVD